ncbi:hypothetical protein EV426DRAFT_557602 [Tirmania nivea]|nr:hypothetical protein EV426DRAFT_557602 [Tirmania nivea]
MRLPTYPPSALSAFASLYQLLLNGTSVSPISPEVGLGVLFHPEKYNPAHPPLLTIGKDLILSAETVESAAKIDPWIRDLLRSCSIQPWGRNPRLMIMLYLAVIMVRGSTVGVSSGGIWSEYIKFLPDVSVPTTWTEEECALLRGTSLDLAVISKKAVLAHEFHSFQSLTSSIPWCKQYFWNPSSPSSLLTLRNWAQIDAWFRSRVLELPGIGYSLIPYLDMVNHSDDAANAYYSLNEDGDIDLLPIGAEDGLLTTKEITEVRINYGPHKSSAELLFTYGFLNTHPPSCQWLSLSLPLSPFDPLVPAKEHILHSPPTVKLIDLPSPSIAWLSSEIWLLSTNADDGLEFKVLQQTDGSQELVLYWRDDTEMDGGEGVLIDDMDTLRRCLEKSNLWEVFHLRAIVTLQQVVADKLQQLRESEEVFTTIVESAKRSSILNQTGTIEHQEKVREGVVTLARELKERERRLLSKSITWFEEEKERLAKTEVVQRYLAKAQEGQEEQEGRGDGRGDGREDEEEDFS